MKLTVQAARFRIKKKHKTVELERNVVDLEGRADDLEKEATELRKENGWLKEMLIMKGRKMRQAPESSNDESDDSTDYEGGQEKGSGSRSKGDKGKGKEKEK